MEANKDVPHVYGLRGKEIMNIDTYIHHFKEDNQFRLVPSTIQHYQQSVRKLWEHVQLPIDMITTKDIRNWLSDLEEVEGYKPSSIATHLTGINAFFTYCVEEEFITNNPTSGIPRPKVGEKLPNYLTSLQLVGLREMVKGNVLERAIIEVYYSTGVRFNELRGITKANINWSERSILIKGKGNKERIVLFSKACGEHLKVYLASRTDDLPYVFVNQLATREIGKKIIYKMFRNYSTSLGVKITPHMLRYTFAVHLIQKGMDAADVQDLLGHENPKTTRLYTRLYGHALKEQYDKWT